MLTTMEAAEVLGLNPSRVRQLARAGIMPGVQRGGTWFFTQEAIDQAKQRKTRTGPKSKK